MKSVSSWNYDSSDFYFIFIIIVFVVSSFKRVSLIQDQSSPTESLSHLAEGIADLIFRFEYMQLWLKKGSQHGATHYLPACINTFCVMNNSCICAHVYGLISNTGCEL